VPDQYWKLLVPVVTNLRNIALCMVATYVIGKPWQQATMMMLVESLVLGFEIAADMKMTRADYWALVLMRGFTVLYIGLKNLSTSPNLTDQARQFKVGMLMAGALLSLMGVGAIFAIYTVGCMALDALRFIQTKIKAYRELRKLLKNTKNDCSVNQLDSNLSNLASPGIPIDASKVDGTDNQKSKAIMLGTGNNLSKGLHGLKSRRIVKRKQGLANNEQRHTEAKLREVLTIKDTIEKPGIVNEKGTQDTMGMPQRIDKPKKKLKIQDPNRLNQPRKKLKISLKSKGLLNAHNMKSANGKNPTTEVNVDPIEEIAIINTAKIKSTPGF
jgi:hypothetical protein